MNGISSSIVQRELRRELFGDVKNLEVKRQDLEEILSQLKELQEEIKITQLLVRQIQNEALQFLSTHDS